MNKTDAERQYEIEQLYEQALDRVITNYVAMGKIGFINPQRIGGWICRELRKRGHLAVTGEREQYLLGVAKKEIACAENLNCEECATCKILENYKDMLVLYDWLKENYEK
jgi:hypothetical protein